MAIVMVGVLILPAEARSMDCFKGEDGKDGVDGIDGVDGRDGTDGVDGVGIQGVKGLSGNDGQDLGDGRRNHVIFTTGVLWDRENWQLELSGSHDYGDREYIGNCKILFKL